MSLVIVEGPDGAGKTTLINSLLAELGGRCFHNGAYLGEEKISPHYFGQLYFALIHTNQLTVLDRAWFAEPIYGAAMRGGADRLSELEKLKLQQLAKSANARVVLCLPPYEICSGAWATRVKEGKEYLDTLEKLKQVYAGYTRMSADGLRMMRYDYTTQNPGDVMKFLETTRGY